MNFMSIILWLILSHVCVIPKAKRKNILLYMYDLKNNGKLHPSMLHPQSTRNQYQWILKDLSRPHHVLIFPQVISILNFVFITVLFALKILPNVLCISKKYVASFGCYWSLYKWNIILCDLVFCLTLWVSESSMLIHKQVVY